MKDTNPFDMFSEILTYNNKKFIVIIDDYYNIWFLAKDICKILEYVNTNDVINKKVSDINKTK